MERVDEAFASAPNVYVVVSRSSASPVGVSHSEVVCSVPWPSPPSQRSMDRCRMVPYLPRASSLMSSELFQKSRPLTLPKLNQSPMWCG